MRTTFVNCLFQRAAIDEDIFLITADLGFSVFENFAKTYPDKFLNAGISEQNAVSVAAGMALSGKKVYVYSIIPFITMRCFEQIRIDVAYMNTNVKLVGVGSGYAYGPQGSTHHAIEDIAVMRALPNMTVCCPSDPIEARGLINESFSYKGPMYIRLARNNEPHIHQENIVVKIGKANVVTEGSDFVIFTTGNILDLGIAIATNYFQKGKNIRVVSMPTIKPIDYEYITQVVKDRIPILTLEEHNIIGGLGSAVAEIVAETGINVPFKRIGIPDVYQHAVGDEDFLRKAVNMQGNAENFINAVFGW